MILQLSSSSLILSTLLRTLLKNIFLLYVFPFWVSSFSIVEKPFSSIYRIRILLTTLLVLMGFEILIQILVGESRGLF